MVLTRYGRLGASSRLRFFQYFPYLQKNNIDVHEAPLLPDLYLQEFYAKKSRNWLLVACSYWKRLKFLFSAKQFDLIWMEKEAFPDLPFWFESWFFKYNIPFIVDYDDAVFHNYDLSRNLYRRLMAKKIDKIMNRASVVVCGNNYLAERAIRAGAEKVELLPTVIDLERYDVAQGKSNDAIIIGWVGSATTVKYLDNVLPLLLRLSGYINLRLHVVGAEASCPGLDVQCFPWSEEREVALIQEFTIGIMPLDDSPWERGKCGYKLIQYMACGLPVIASPVGVNTSIVKNGENGFLPANHDQWYQALESLCLDADVRKAMGLRGRQDVVSKYCIQVTGSKMLHMISDSILSGQK